jgi:putative endonuclease
MHYVYLIEGSRGNRYVGFTTDLRQRLFDHNEGRLRNTARYRPWRLITYLGFSSRKQALAFEHYVKSGSGHAFARKHLWPSPPA